MKAQKSKGVNHAFQAGLAVVLSLLGLLTIIPFLWVIVTSIKPNNEIYSVTKHILPMRFSFEHFHKVISKGAQLPRYVFNTFVYSFFSISAIAILGSMAGYALGAIKIPLSKYLVNLVLLLLSIPWVILIVPILLFEFEVRIWNTYAGVILPYIGLFLPFAIWIMRGAFLELSPELGHAARIDGASESTVFLKIYLPQAKGGVATVVLLTFIDVWNEVLIAATMAKNPEIANINVGLRILADEGQSFAFGTLSAAILITMIPTLAVFAILQRYYVRGISEGAFAGF